MKNFLIISALLSAGSIAAQPVIKLYAYSQVDTPGIVPQRDIPAEDGAAPVKKPAAVISYYIYASLSRIAAVQFSRIWIKGQWYKIRTTAAVTTPVITDQPVVKTLVPATRQKVVQVQQGDSLIAPQKSFAALKKMMSNSKLILAYTWKSKTWYIPVKKITELEPMHAL
ncbi:MAG: hypothetical protein FJY20_04325 [Bacteroidetes bacterium]|nr:hypothetical protein [Bacteroidota bacterium]